MEPALARISRETVRLDGPIGQLLALTRLSAEAIQVDSFDLCEVLQELVNDAAFEAQSHHKKVLLEAAGPCTMVGSRDQWHSAVENVVRNALRFTPEGTAVEVCLTCGHNICITVRDHGPGVPEAALPRLFEPFFRVEEARDRHVVASGWAWPLWSAYCNTTMVALPPATIPAGGLEITLCAPMTAAT